MTIAKKWRSFIALDPVDRVLFAEALVLTAVIPAGFRLFGVNRTQGLLRRWSSLAATKDNAGRDPHRVVRMARRAELLLRRTGRPDGTCLTRSLTVWTLLLRRGLATDLRVGVRRAESGIEAHAWLELHGTPVNEDPDVVSSYGPYPSPLSFDDYLNIRTGPSQK